MKKSNHNITYILRLLAVVSIVCAMMIQPTIQSLAYLNNQDFELVEMDTEENSNEKESQEEDSIDENTELELSSPHYNPNMLIKKSSIFGKQHLKWDFTLETHIPPPEQA